MDEVIVPSVGCRKSLIAYTETFFLPEGSLEQKEAAEKTPHIWTCLYCKGRVFRLNRVIDARFDLIQNRVGRGDEDLRIGFNFLLKKTTNIYDKEACEKLVDYVMEIAQDSLTY